MVASVSATYDLKLNVNETLALLLDNATDPPILHALTAHVGTLTGTSTPAVTKAFSKDIAMTSGVATLDLTSLTGPMGTTVDFTGLKVQLVKLACPATNTKPVTVGVKGANAGTPVIETGYNLFGESQEDLSVLSLSPAARTASANGSSADLNDCRTAWVVVQAGTVTDGTHVVKLQESDDNAVWNDVAAADVIGGTATFTDISSDTISKSRYIGDKRYLRVVLTVTGATTGAVMSVLIYREPPSIDILPGMGMAFFADDELADVGVLEKEIQFHGTGTETIEVLLVAG